jgi:hypothetical protein
MSSISLRIPEDVIADLKLLAPTLGFSGTSPCCERTSDKAFDGI